ncbi:flagellar protein [Campylobacter sp. Marseille-Q3452]|uniref:Flagellar protein n=1 Tax=Campylobacter massiliensis TaxID=2762557 RepID=A0A842JBM2_9BACT|nr:flagellar protein [Campylobacter massiliensis]MBC2883349.1 flagellar protein [Campylobacter massiliensis]
MGSAWSYSAKECSADGKFSAEFEGHEIAMGAPSLGELRLYASAEAQGLNLKCEESDGENENVKFSQSGEILLSEQATACFTFSDDSRFLAFAEWTADKMQLVKVLRLADMSLKTVDRLQRVAEFLSFRDGLLEILDSPIFMPGSFWVDVRELFDDEIKS